MVRRPHAGAWRTGPQTPYSITPREVPLAKFGSLDMMGADDGQAPLRRDATPPPLGGNPRKLGSDQKTHFSREGWTPIRVSRTCSGATTETCHHMASLLRGYPMQIFFQKRGTNSPIGGNPWKNSGSPGRMYTNQGPAHLLRGNHINPSLHEIPPRGGTLEVFLPRLGNKFSCRGEPQAKFCLSGGGGKISG